HRGAHYVYASLSMSDDVYYCCSINPSVAVPEPTSRIRETEKLTLEEERMWDFSVVAVGVIWLYILLLAMLKYRAAYHRKIRKISDSATSLSRLQSYLEEVNILEAKMLPVSNRIFSAIWSFSCLVVVCILFPKDFAFGYASSWFMSTLPHVCVDEEVRRRLLLAGVKDFVYNGRRYRVLEIEAFYSVLYGEDDSILHYPTRDLPGLVVPEDGQTGLP
ncbi:hypothetical protein PSACC_00357, partial [Paramicrosporidium saccamoebae]